METIPELKNSYQPIEEMIYGSVKSRLLLTAIELKLFDVLDTGQTPESVAQALGTQPGNTRLLLKALTACGLVCMKNGLFENSPESAAFLDTRSPTCIAGWLGQASAMFDPILENLPELVKTGTDRPIPEQHMNSREMCEYYTHAHAQTELAGIAHRTASLVRALPQWEGMARMLDLGGGPGLNAVALVSAHPSLCATVFDRPAVVAVARDYIGQYGQTDRIETIGGDYFCDDLGRGYDLVLASDTLYYEDHRLEQLAGRIFDALNPGGVLVGIHGVLSQDRTSPPGLVLGMLPDALMGQGELPDSGFLAPALVGAGFSRVHTRQVRMVSNHMEVDVAHKPL